MDNDKLEIEKREQVSVDGSSDHTNEPFVFDEAAERKLRWKLDVYLVPTVALLYLFCFIDRANIGNARLAGLERDLHMAGFNYNQLLSVFYIAYIVFEIPGTLACKWIGPGWFIPATTLGFGICSLCMAYVNTLASACGVRFLLGIFEASVLPGIAYYLSRWYRRSELAFRIALYIVMAPLAGAFGGLLASGILKLQSFAGVHEWRMIFLIEGIVTICLSVIGVFTLTDRPETARWLSADEKALAIARVKSERIATKILLDRIDVRKIQRGIFNPTTLVTAFIFLLNNITVQGLAFFLPTIVRTIYPHNSLISQQLHTVPPYIVGAFFALFFPFLSWRIDRRLVFIIAAVPMAIVGYIMFLATDNPHARYGATFLIAAGAFPFGALVNAHVSANVVSDTARSGAIGTVVMFGNVGGLIATWSFLPNDAPNYPIGNGLNLAVSAAALIVSVSLILWTKASNKKREARGKEEVDAELAGLSQKEIEDLDWKHPEFRWRQ